MHNVGTGVEFNIEYSGAGGAAQWRPALKVNGTTPPGTAQVTAIGVANLPLGTHEVELTLARVDGASDASARVLGVVGTLGYEAGPGSSNHTIDDSHWASGQVNLSQGWNMMEKGHSNTLNEVSRVDVCILATCRNRVIVIVIAKLTPV